MTVVRKTVDQQDTEYVGRKPKGPAVDVQAVGGEIVPAAMPSAVEVSQLMAESQRRHDLERRLAALAIEYDRSLAALQALIRRHDQLQAECEASRPPMRIQHLVPSLLRTALRLARDQVRAEYPELKSLTGPS